MKDKIKNILICSVQYKLIYTDKIDGGETELTNKIIKVGTKNKGLFKEILFHEIGEAVMYEIGCRFTLYEEGNDRIKFVMSHLEFECFCKHLMQALKGV